VTKETHADSSQSGTQRICVPFVDLHAQHEPLAADIQRALGESIRRGDFILGEETRRFERAFAEYVGVGHAIGVGNGLDALRLTLTAFGIGSGDEVLVPANTFIATAYAVSSTGARPAFVDCDPQTYNIDPRQIAAAVTPRTKAVIPVHLTGRPAEMNAVLAVAREHGLYVVEDVAQAAGATYFGRRCGALADAGCFSFYPAKNLGALGDAGLIATDDEELANRLRCLRHYGQRQRYEHVEIGFNSRLDTVHAAVLNVKLPHLDAWNAARAEHAALYRERLTGVGDLRFAELHPQTKHVYHLFAIETEARDALQDYLTSCGIETLVHYPRPIHLQEAYRRLGCGPGAFPAAERLAQRLLSLPMYPEMPRAHLQYVVDAIRRWFDLQRHPLAG